MFADRKLSFEEIKQKSGLDFNLDQYIDAVSENALDVEKYLSTKDSILKSAEIQKLHLLLNKGIARDAGVINGKRHLAFFDKDGQRNMVEGKRIFQELKLLDLQTKKLISIAGNNKEEQIKAICFQVMRLFAIHPFNDANKRMVKLLLGNFLQKELGLKNIIPLKEIPQKVINQAVRGNNIGPFARTICENYGIDYDGKKISEIELTTYKIYPDTGSRVHSLSKELELSRIRPGHQICTSEPLISKKELSEMGFQTTSLNPFKKIPVVEDLLATKTPESLLHKTRSYLSQGKISEIQAKNLLKKAIIIIDGTNDKYSELATKKILNGEMNDVKKAVNFYEKPALQSLSSSVKHPIKIVIQETEKVTEVYNNALEHKLKI